MVTLAVSIFVRSFSSTIWQRKAKENDFVSSNSCSFVSREQMTGVYLDQSVKQHFTLFQHLSSAPFWRYKHPCPCRPTRLRFPCDLLLFIPRQHCLWTYTNARAKNPSWKIRICCERTGILLSQESLFCCCWSLIPITTACPGFGFHSTSLIAPSFFSGWPDT